MRYKINHNETKNLKGITLYRLMGEDGSKGGWAEKEESIDPNFDGLIGEDAIIYSCARIFGGEIFGGVIFGGRIFGGRILGGVIRGGMISGGLILGGVINGGEINGGEINGGEIWCGFYLERPPIITGSLATCTLDSEGYICIGCERHLPDYWLKNYEGIGRRHDYSDKEIAEYKVYIDALAAIAKERK